MDFLLKWADSQLVLVVAAITVSFLLATLLLRILKTGWRLILAILVIVLVLQSLFGISPKQLWGEIGNLPQDVIFLTRGISLNAITSMLSK